MVHHQFGANFEFRSSLLVPVRLWISNFSFSFFLFFSKTINFLSFWYLIITCSVYISSLFQPIYWNSLASRIFSHWTNINQFDWLKIIPSKSHFMFLELFFHKKIFVFKLLVFWNQWFSMIERSYLGWIPWNFKIFIFKSKLSFLSKKHKT